ncbi:MAG: hypothetical protein GXP32_08420 [Kiritimatiellaeota bacterium]|nr:hypothetical protein [Kiritimatiellota bacterium]
MSLDFALKLNPELEDARLLKAKFDFADRKFIAARDDLRKVRNPPEYLKRLIEKYVGKTETTGYKITISDFRNLISELGKADDQLLMRMLKIRSRNDLLKAKMKYLKLALRAKNPYYAKKNKKGKYVNFMDLRYSRLKDGALDVNLSYNMELRNVSPLAVGLPIKSLNLRNTNVDDLRALDSLKTLKELDIQETAVKDVSFLPSLKLDKLKVTPSRFGCDEANLAKLKKSAWVRFDFDKVSLSENGKLKNFGKSQINGKISGPPFDKGMIFEKGALGESLMCPVSVNCPVTFRPPSFTILFWVPKERVRRTGYGKKIEFFRMGLKKWYQLRIFSDRYEISYDSTNTRGRKKRVFASRLPFPYAPASEANPRDDDWWQLAFVFEPSGPSIYLNGRLVSKNLRDYRSSYASGYYKAHPWRILAKLMYDKAFWRISRNMRIGEMIDDFMFWNRALSKEDIRSLYEMRKIEQITSKSGK